MLFIYNNILISKNIKNLINKQSSFTKKKKIILIYFNFRFFFNFNIFFYFNLFLNLFIIKQKNLIIQEKFHKNIKIIIYIYCFYFFLVKMIYFKFSF